MPHPPAGHRTPEGGGHVILHQQVGETLGAVFASESDQGRAVSEDGEISEVGDDGWSVRLSPPSSPSSNGVPQAPRS